MAELVYIPSISQNSWMHWSKKGSISKLRFLQQNGEWAAAIEECTAYIEGELEGEQCERGKAARVPITNKYYWQEELRLRNIESGLIKDDDSRLLSLYTREWGGIWSSAADSRRGEQNPGIVITKKWAKIMQKANDWVNRVNRWDDHDATEEICGNTGQG